MTLIPIHTTVICLPELKLMDYKVAGNKIQRFAARPHQTRVTIYDAEQDGWFLLIPELPFPYDRLFLRKPGKRGNRPARELCLELVTPCSVTDINATTRLKWVHHPGSEDTREPDAIVGSWAGQFQFREDKPDLGQPGLRIPQLGALHAISAHFSLKNNFDPATIVLPTGTGKTETMLATMVYHQIPRLLVMVPSNALRRQISEKFFGLGYLARLGVIPFTTAMPYVAVIKTGVNSVEEADNLLNHANVFVATASVLNASDQSAIDRLCDGIAALFVDEAHHISAATWAIVRERFKNKKVVQFTATPFRNDGSALGGRIIYNYTMGEAQQAGYFRPINLLTVEEYYTREGDLAIARKAVQKLRADNEAGYDHLLMARVDKKSRADDLLPIYRRLAPELNPVVVYSGLSNTEIESALAAVFDRRSRIVICVEMLGEGFDLPNLKIAAIHDFHKSLAITLQFIGRFTRQSIKVGDASVVVNVAEPEVETGLQRLYAQGADWDGVLRRLAEERIEREVRLQEVVDRLKERGNLHHQLSLWNLRPSFSAMLFKTTCERWNPEKFSEVLPNKTEHWFAISEVENLLVLLAIHQAPVKWGHYKDLNDNVYKLLILHWDKDREGLFVFASDYKWINVQRLATIICGESCELLSGSRVFNLFNGLEYPLVRNLGASQAGAISFTQYFGSNVTEGLSLIESSQSYLSNLAGLGYDNGEKVIWGCSQKNGKIWSVTGGSIPDWMSWVKAAWGKVTAGDVDERNITRNFLRPKRMDSQYDHQAIAVQWGEHIQADPEDRVVILFGETEVPLYLVDLKIVSQGTGKPYQISVSSDDLESIYEFSIDERLLRGVSYQIINGRPVSVKRGNRAPEPIEEYLNTDPWIIQYVNGSYSYNRFLIELSQSTGELDPDRIEVCVSGNVKMTRLGN